MEKKAEERYPTRPEVLRNPDGTLLAFEELCDIVDKNKELQQAFIAGWQEATDQFKDERQKEVNDEEAIKEVLNTYDSKYKTPDFIEGFSNGWLERGYTLKSLSPESGEQEPEAARHHLSPVWVKELVDIRNKLYDSLPTGEVKAWDFIQLIKWHLNDIDVFCERFEHPSSLTAVQFAEWMDNSISWTKLTIEKLEVNCFDEDSEMSIRVGKSGYQSLSVDEVKDLANFLISHIKNETESNTDPPVQIIGK